MTVTLQLFGAFRDFEPSGALRLDLPEGAQIADLRAAVAEHAGRCWPGFQPALLSRSAFASESQVLRDHDPVPSDGRAAVLPPVSGG